MLKELQTNFIIHVCKYLGIALVAGSIVHAGTLGGSNPHYLSLIGAGTALTVFGNYLEFAVKGIHVGMRFLALAICLSFGTGMLSGGIQHFADNPSYGAILLSLGAALTYFSMALKDFPNALNLKSIILAIACSVGLYFILLGFGTYVLSEGQEHHQTDTHVHG